ncbi:hypothetical protein G647_00171 [Cladophialophora carrionii CBS 160.54]|uniref:Smr domain-containing protein n=1 Tax=Cladophialophora carrionii CBS 160.54 TaxID=1279043 RepID=V9DP33_9EURO|nr:uncharacterized protein G647_00171 [Cladophialophora carrionii CBS 160.54]ETI27722.1 hypothetical protein G647_00171 [Cladophialophora carrionii CBS 160.54]
MGEMAPRVAELEALRATYCPPLDEALFHAIASDYTLPQNKGALVAVLDDLAVGALEQEDTEFDPSGTDATTQVRDTTNTSRSSPEESFSNGVTSITTCPSEPRSSDADSLGHGLHNSSEGQKTTWLENMFPGIPRRELTSILASHDGSLDKATDELLNLSFLKQGYEEETEELPAPKGVDGFAAEMQSSRKSRKRRKPRTNDSSRGSSASSSLHKSEHTPVNVWSTMSEDVEFICSRTKLHPQTVRSEYHLNGARLSSTIRALAAKEAAEHNRVSDTNHILDLQIAEFQHRYEHVPVSQLCGLLSLARNIPSAAQELLEAMTVVDDTTKPGKLYDVAQYTPIDLKENQPFETPSGSKWTSVTAQPRASAASQRIGAGQKFGQASAAYKKSKSNPLFGGAAAYYAEVAHEQLKAAKEAHAAEADALVSNQSSANVLDLHGVSVQDAVRIASAKTQSWWDGLGDAKYATGGGGPARAGYRIVTGLGTHSKNQAPRIGPAVSKMLIREGWKVEIGHGELIVTGKARR